MTCDICGNKSIVFGKLHPITRIDNTANCGSLAGHGRHPSKKLICYRCLGLENFDEEEKANETS
jgi:hypothetical protein